MLDEQFCGMLHPCLSRKINIRMNNDVKERGWCRGWSSIN